MGFNIQTAASVMKHGGKNETAAVQLRDVVQIDDRFARVIAVASVNASPDQVFAGIKSQFKNVTPIPGSFMSIASDAQKHIFEGIVGIVAERVVATNDNREKFKAVAGNMFMTEDENLWALRKTATGEVFVKSTCADDSLIMQQLMAVAANDHNDFGNQDIGVDSANIRACVEGGSLVSYVSQQSADLQMGIAVAAIDNHDGTPTPNMLFVRPNGQTETVHRDMIVALSGDEVDDGQDTETATAANIDMNVIASYYARVFARRPEYFQLFMQRARAHAFF